MDLGPATGFAKRVARLHGPGLDELPSAACQADEMVGTLFAQVILQVRN